MADLNGDGWLDLVFCGSANFEHRMRKAEAYIYFGGPSGFYARDPVRLEGYVNLKAGVADLNRDGFLDMYSATTAQG